MMNPEEAYTISFAGVPAGKYPYHCLPHLAMNMKGVITVE
jgi:plastocyanin